MGSYSWNAKDYAKQREAFIDELVANYIQAMPPDRDGNVHVQMVRLEVEARKP